MTANVLESILFVVKEAVKINLYLLLTQGIRFLNQKVKIPVFRTSTVTQMSCRAPPFCIATATVNKSIEDYPPFTNAK